MVNNTKSQKHMPGCFLIKWVWGCRDGAKGKKDSWTWTTVMWLWGGGKYKGTKSSWKNTIKIK